MLQLAGQQLKAIRPGDEFEAYGKYVAHKLRSLKGNQAVFARKLINDVIFEGELEALTKDFKVINSQPHYSFETNDVLQFPPQLYHSTYIPRRFEHQLSNMPMPNSQHISNTTSPNSLIKKLEKANSEQPNIQQPEIQPHTYSNYTPSSSKTSNTDLNQSMENNVSSFFSKFI